CRRSITGSPNRHAERERGCTQISASVAESDAFGLFWRNRRFAAQRVGPVERFFFLGLIGVAFVVAGIVWAWLQFRQEATSIPAVPPQPPPSAARPEVPAGPAVPDITAPERPSFDVVRVNPAGDAVMAG